MQRYALGLEYLGTKYKGWQKQKKTNQTIQYFLEESLSKIADEQVKVFCSGRTDAGVHSKLQITHFDTNAYRKIDSWILGTNSILPKDISVKWVKKVPDTFHARFSAIKRTYRYHIFNGRQQSVLNRNFTLHIKDRINITNMIEASRYLIGEKDFSSFRASGCQSNSPKRNIFNISIKKNAQIISIEISANAFLLNMVRIIVGTLIEIGTKEIEPTAMKEIIYSKDRKNSGRTVDSKGLFFIGAEYPDEFKLKSPVYNKRFIT